MPDSASGVSNTRSSPKSFCRPSVTRKTPPSLPTSSPMIRTLGSFSMALRSPALIALDRVRVVIVRPPRRNPGRLGVHVVEDGQRRRVGHGPARLADPRADLDGLGVHRGEEVGVGLAGA